MRDLNRSESRVAKRKPAAFAKNYFEYLKSLSRGVLWYFRPPKKNRGEEEGSLIASINEAAKSVGAQSLTFFVTATYIAISAAEVKDEFFIFHDKLTLPIANVSIPVEWFFLVAPTLLVGLHLMILLHEYYLLEKLAALPWKSGKVRTELFFPSISISGHFPREYLPVVGGLVFASFWFLYVVVPVAALVYLQMCALRFRIASVEHGINVCVAVTLVASTYFVIVTHLVKRSNSDLWGPSESSTETTSGRGVAAWRSVIRTSAMLGKLAVLAFLAWFVYSYVAMLRYPKSCRGESRFLEVFTFRRHLILTSISERLQAESSARKGGFNFRSLDLRCAKFSNVQLVNADFRGANLSGAEFDGADLRGANFSSLRRNKTNLKGASLARADLTRAKFHGALLMEAFLRRANLQEADLSEADLSKARMSEANLVAADLTRSRLRGAVFRKARLAFAKLDYASIELARFDDALADRTSFRGAALFGASFRGARLRGASGLPLAGVDLQSAWVWGLNSCGALSGFPTHVNLRALRFDPVGTWQPILEEIRTAAKNPLLPSTWVRMKAPLATPEWTSDPTCFSEPDEIGAARSRGWSTYLKEKNVLYDKRGTGNFFEELPEQPPLTEEEYLLGLARELIKKACLEEFEPPRGGTKGSTLRDLLELRAKEELGRFGQILRQQLDSVSCESLAGTAP